MNQEQSVIKRNEAPVTHRATKASQSVYLLDQADEIKNQFNHLCEEDHSKRYLQTSVFFLLLQCVNLENTNTHLQQKAQILQGNDEKTRTRFSGEYDQGVPRENLHITVSNPYNLVWIHQSNKGHLPIKKAALILSTA